MADCGEESCTRIIVDSRSRRIGEEPDAYTVVMESEVKRTTGVRMVWANIPGKASGVIDRGNDQLRFESSDGVGFAATLRHGTVYGAMDVADTIASALPDHMTAHLDPANTGRIVIESSSDAFRVLGNSSAARLAGVHPAGTGSGTNLVMAYPPDVEADAFLNLFLDTVSANVVSSLPESGGVFACVPVAGLTEFGSSFRSPTVRGSVGRFRVRFERPGGFPHDFQGRDHAFAVDVYSRERCSR